MSERRPAAPPPDPREQVRRLREQFREELAAMSFERRKEIFSRLGDNALYAPVFFDFACESVAMPPTDLLPPEPGTYPRISPRVFLARERAAENRSEYYDGEVVAMAGASERHVLIAQNISSHLYFRLGSQCRVYQSDLKVQADGGAEYMYPDVMVICGNPRFVDAARDVVTNPAVVFEVLSRGTERKDRTRKAEANRRIPSLAAYVLVAQREPRLEVYERGADGVWECALYQRLDDLVFLDAIGCELTMAEIYRNVFAPPTVWARPRIADPAE